MSQETVTTTGINTALDRFIRGFPRSFDLPCSHGRQDWEVRRFLFFQNILC